jgi:hypothetical protein
MNGNFQLIHEIIYQMERLYGDYCQIVENRCYLDRALKNKKIKGSFYTVQLAFLKKKEMDIEAKFDITFKQMYTNNELYNIKLSYILQLIKTYPKDYKQWLSLLCGEINKNNVNHRLTIL